MEPEQLVSGISPRDLTNQSADQKNGCHKGETSTDPSKEWLHNLWWQVSDAQEETDYYDRTAKDYESVTNQLNWRAPELCMKTITNWEQKSGEVIPRHSVAIDIGAGTGLSGVALREIGFTGPVDALEPSANMFALAKQKNIYRDWYGEMLVEGEETTVPSDMYDLAFSVGVFSDRSAKKGSMSEVLRMVKKGGYIAVIMVARHWLDEFRDHIALMEAEGLVKTLHVDMFDADMYMREVAAVAFVMKKL